MTYIGKSAGSYIACPSLIVSTWSQLTFNKFDITDLSAMHRVDFFVKAHYTPEMAASLQSHAQELTAPLYALTNDQALVIDGEKMEWIGGGDEVVFGK
ncbi:MAG: Type 1 glutamine amidotransferase-like domain-containing protein [bacterium]